MRLPKILVLTCTMERLSASRTAWPPGSARGALVGWKPMAWDAKYEGSVNSKNTRLEQTNNFIYIVDFVLKNNKKNRRVRVLICFLYLTQNKREAPLRVDPPSFHFAS